MQLDAKARIERALHDPLAVHFQDPRRREATHQRQSHLRGIGAGLRRKQQRLADCFDVQRDDDLVRHLRRLAITVAADERDVLAHQLEQRFYFREGRLAAADHDRERRRLGAHFAARDRCIEIVAAKRVDPFRELFRRERRDRAHVNDDLALAEPLRDAVLAEQRGLDVRRVRNHRDDDVRFLRDLLAVRACAAARMDERLRNAGNTEEE